MVLLAHFWLLCTQIGLLHTDQIVLKAFIKYGYLCLTLGCTAQKRALQGDNTVLKAFNRYFGPTLGCCAQIGVLQEDNARLKAFNKYEEIERVQKLAAEETETVRRLLTAEADAARTKAAADVKAVRDSAASDAEAIRQAC